MARLTQLSGLPEVERHADAGDVAVHEEPGQILVEEQYSNQQLSATFGGPIRRDKLHLFGHYEYEREPQTWTYTTPYPSFNIDQSSTRKQQMGGARMDLQLSPQTRFMVRGNRSSNSCGPTRVSPMSWSFHG